MKLQTIIIFIIPFLGFSQNQNSLNDKKETIFISQTKINDLVDKYKQILKKKNGVDGWRLQIKFTLKQEQIRPFQSKFSRLYPDINTHVTFDSPFYKLSVGNFRTKMEALKLKKRISQHFKGCYPIQAIIEIDLLK